VCRIRIQRIIIRHDNSGFVPAWFLDKVIESGLGESWYFPCGRWLTKDEDDGQILREILVVKSDVTTYAPLVMYKVTVLTGDVPGNGTNAAVFMTLIGPNNSQSQETRLESSRSNTFQRGTTNVFPNISMVLSQKSTYDSLRRVLVMRMVKRIF